MLVNSTFLREIWYSDWNNQLTISWAWSCPPHYMRLVKAKPLITRESFKSISFLWCFIQWGSGDLGLNCQWKFENGILLNPFLPILDFGLFFFSSDTDTGLDISNGWEYSCQRIKRLTRLKKKCFPLLQCTLISNAEADHLEFSVSQP